MNVLKTKKSILIFILSAAIFALGVKGFIFYRVNLRGIGPAFFSPTINLSDLGEATSSDLGRKFHPGFQAEIFAKGLPGARVLKFDQSGNLWISQTGEGKISIIEKLNDGVFSAPQVVYTGLRNPHGLAFDPQNPKMLYIAEENRITRRDTGLEIDGQHLQKIADLPSGGGHETRTINFGPDGRLYVAIGSSCNVCLEKDERRAKIFSMNKDGSDFKEFARGLRNSVFFTWSYVDGRMWATEMGRDNLGDDVPPDEVNVIEAGGNYGWPICFGRNVHDDNFDKNTYFRNPCMAPFEKESAIDLPAHSAPLGLAFIPEDGKWPSEYAGDLLVAYHGSWNRSIPTGYKIVRLRLDALGRYLDTEDFISGWLTEDSGKYSSSGRPVDIYVSP